MSRVKKAGVGTGWNRFASLRMVWVKIRNPRNRISAHLRNDLKKGHPTLA